MKRLLLFFSLLFSISFYGQNDTIASVKVSNISVVSADKMNVVYRGIPNPISIAVSNCKSFEATGNRLTKLQNGKYTLNPGSGSETTITIYIVLNDGSTKKEEHKFRIKNIPYLCGAINGLTCKQSVILMSKNELKKATLSLEFSNDFQYELKFNLVSFTVNINKKNIYISGNKLNKEVLVLIEKLPLNSIFEITNFKSDVNCNNCSFPYVNPIKIMIVEDRNYKDED